MTWRRSDEGYEAFFNRDERRSRRPAEPAAARHKGTLRYLAPLDGDFGGTWLGVNAVGLTLALLNGYMDPADRKREPSDGFTSRGLLLTDLIDAVSIEHVLQRLARTELGRFRSFHLVALEPRASAIGSWLGGSLSLARDIDERMPIISSSFDTEEVCRSRRELFHEMRSAAPATGTALHLAYHRSHLPEMGPRSVCMHRPEAQTVSFSRIEVGAAEIRFHYTPHPPCRGLPAREPLSLARVSGAPARPRH